MVLEKENGSVRPRQRGGTEGETVLGKEQNGPEIDRILSLLVEHS